MEKLVHYTYFKPSGKYYSEGTGILPLGAEIQKKTRKLLFGSDSAPGLNSQGREFFIVADVKDGVPFLVPPEPLGTR